MNTGQSNMTNAFTAMPAGTFVPPATAKNVTRISTVWAGRANNRNSNQVYGLTRAFHVGDRCIECGECERVCPMGLPIMRQTKKMLKDINDLFGDYECGLNDSRPHVLGEFDLQDRDEFM